MRPLRPLLILLTVLLTGCALSPQQVQITPEITLSESAPNVRSSVSVTLFDERIDPVLGSRGGAYADSSNLTLKPDFASSIQQEAERVLKQMGLTIDNQNPLITFNIYLDKLSYSTPNGHYVTEVNLETTLRSEIQRGNKRFQGRYQAQSQNRVMAAPDDEKNQELVNQVINDALNRVFQDQALLDFIASP